MNSLAWNKSIAYSNSYSCSSYKSPFVLHVSDDSNSTDDSPTIDEDGVYVLSEANFDQFIEDSAVALVEFYAPWYVFFFTIVKFFFKFSNFKWGN